MKPLQLSLPNVQFQGWHKRTNVSLKNVNAGDTLFLRTVNAGEARPENQIRYEAVKVISVEGHQGRAYNPHTMSIKEASIDSRNGSRCSSNDSICVTNQPPPVDMDEQQMRNRNIPWDEVDMVTFVDSQGQEKSILYGEYLKKEYYRDDRSERVNVNKFNDDTQLMELYTPEGFAKHTHQERANLVDKVHLLAAQLNAINGLFKGNLDELVAKVLDHKVV